MLSTLTRVLFTLACAALLLMLGAYVAEVVLRYIFNAPTRWSSDVVSYAMLVSVVFALPAVTRDGGHVAITSLVERLAPARQALALRALAWLSAAVCLAAVVLMGQQGLAQWQGGIDTVAAIAIPKWWLSAAVAIGLAGAAAHFVAHALAPAATALGGEREL
jgi:TRAP-type C4-dicarboxylate transport system permease small subunit